MRSPSIIVLNWNGWRDTLDCLTSLQNLDYPNHPIVVDNASTDDSVAQIRAAFPTIDLVQSLTNLGFAGGCNLGIRRSLGRGADYVWLLNNDTKVHPHALRALVERADSDPKIGAVGSAIYSMRTPAQLQVWGGGHVDFYFGRALHLSRPAPPQHIQYLTGTSLFLKREAVDSVGLLDEGFFMYWEDTDYCFRLRKAGWRLAVAEESKIWHKEQGSVGKKSLPMDVYFNRSAVRFFKRHATFPLAPIGFSLLQRLARWALAGDLRRVRAVWAGINESGAAFV